MSSDNNEIGKSIKIVVSGPKSESATFDVNTEECAIQLMERLDSCSQLNSYTHYHFEISGKKGQPKIVIGGITPFSEIPEVGDKCTFELVTEQYTALAIRDHIRHSVALLTGTLPLVGQVMRGHDSTLPKSLEDFARLIEEAKAGQKPGAVTPNYFSSGRIQEDTKLVETIAKLSIPITMNLESLSSLTNSLSEKNNVPVKSVTLSSFNPVSSQRQLMGDLIYIRVVTIEGEVFHVTGSADGFFVNQSRDGDFSSLIDTTRNMPYLTLPSLLCAVSPQFASWFKLFVSKSDWQSNIKLADLLHTLRPLPNLRSVAEGWFSTDESQSDLHNLFANPQTVSERPIPYLSMDSEATRNWIAEYVSIKEDPSINPNVKVCFLVEREHMFAEAAIKGAISIVENSLPSLNSDETAFQVNSITFRLLPMNPTPLDSSVTHNENGSRTIVNYEVISNGLISSLNVDKLHCPLMCIVDYKGKRFLAQAVIPGLSHKPSETMMLYGTVDGGMSIYHDDRCKEIVKELASGLHWAPSTVSPIKSNNTEEEKEVEEKKEVDGALSEAAAAVKEAVGGDDKQKQKSSKKATVEWSAVAASEQILKDPTQSLEFYGPVDGKLLQGADGRMYAIDFIRTQPADVLWLHESMTQKEYGGESGSMKSFILRPELIDGWLLRRAVLESQINEIEKLVEKKEKGEKIEEGLEVLEQFSEKKDIIRENLKAMPELFDVNAFTPFSKRMSTMNTNSNEKEADESEEMTSSVHEKEVLSLNTFLMHEVIPRVCEEIKNSKVVDFDGEQLTKFMHVNGVNMRYLGQMAKYCLSTESSIKAGPREIISDDWQLAFILETEMISRVCKLLASELLNDQVLGGAPAYAVCAFLNGVIQKVRRDEVALEGVKKVKGAKKRTVLSNRAPPAIVNALHALRVFPPSIWADICRLIKQKFHYDLVIWQQFAVNTPVSSDTTTPPTTTTTTTTTTTSETESNVKVVHASMALRDNDRALLLRRICQLVGIRLTPAKLDLNANYVLNPSSIAGFFPVVKYSCNSIVDNGFAQQNMAISQLIQEKQIHLAYELCRETIVNMVGVFHMHHPLIPSLLSIMSRLLYSVQDFAGAVEYGKLALRYTQIVYGKDSVHSAQAHATLSMYLCDAGGLNEALIHQYVSLQIYLLSTGDRSIDLIFLFIQLASLFKNAAMTDKALACLLVIMRYIEKNKDRWTESERKSENVMSVLLACPKELADCYVLKQDWKNALKYEQMYQDRLSEQPDSDIKTQEMANSIEKVKKYGESMKVKSAMKSIIGF